MEVKSTETQIEKALTIKWDMRNSSLKPQQDRFIERMAGFLAENPGATISVSPQQYTVKEKEYIMLYEAKKKYFLAANHKNAQSFTDEDAENVDKMSAKDPQFIKYLNIQTDDSMLFTVQDKCSRLIGADFIDNKYRQLNNERQSAFMSFFVKEDLEKRIQFTANQNVLPFNGFSFYKIGYKGEFPESLMSAYRKMNELNNEAPRKIFKKERRKYKTA
jgi:hypothetical protein